MRKSALSWALAAALVFAGACHKNTSTSSSSGSLVGALNDLALVALNSVGGKTGFPTIGPSCSGISMSGSFAVGTTESCPSSAYQWVATFTPNSLSATVINCQYGGYTFNGVLNFEVASSPLVECNLINPPNGNNDISLTGSYIIASSSLTITGSGLNAVCNSNLGPDGPIDLTASGVLYETAPSNTLVGILNGQGCQTKISNLKFFWQ